MLAILRLLMTYAANLFRSRRQLEVENLFLRHQLNIAVRRAIVVSARPTPPGRYHAAAHDAVHGREQTEDRKHHVG